MLRTHTCGELNISHLGETGYFMRMGAKITRSGRHDIYRCARPLWFNPAGFKPKQHDELRDQKPQPGPGVCNKSTGKVIERTSKNTKMPTGEIEIAVQRYRDIKRG